MACLFLVDTPRFPSGATDLVYCVEILLSSMGGEWGIYGEICVHWKWSLTKPSHNISCHHVGLFLLKTYTFPEHSLSHCSFATSSWTDYWGKIMWLFPLGDIIFSGLWLVLLIAISSFQEQMQSCPLVLAETWSSILCLKRLTIDTSPRGGCSLGDCLHWTFDDHFRLSVL